MEDFLFYFKLGIEHITDLNGYDHMLLIVALSVVYPLNEWKKVALVVTAFTIGHSITLLLATLKIIHVNSSWIEFLIPVTIFLTAANNVIGLKNKKANENAALRYFLALFFGLIHGLGFSNFLRSILGKEANICWPLLSFNLGLEAGQLVIVLISMVISFLVFKLLKIKPALWIGIISGIICLVSILLAIKNIPI